MDGGFGSPSLSPDPKNEGFQVWPRVKVSGLGHMGQGGQRRPELSAWLKNGLGHTCTDVLPGQWPNGTNPDLLTLNVVPFVLGRFWKIPTKSHIKPNWKLYYDGNSPNPFKAVRRTWAKGC